MAKFVKTILFLLFAVTLYVVMGNFFIKNEVKAYTVAIKEEIQEYENIGIPQSPCWPEAEIATGLQSQQVSMSRIQRMHMMEYSLSLKNIMQCVADRDASLFQHQGRIYSTTTSCYCNPVSNYYVFALRHIII